MAEEKEKRAMSGEPRGMDDDLRFLWSATRRMKQETLVPGGVELGYADCPVRLEASITCWAMSGAQPALTRNCGVTSS